MAAAIFHLTNNDYPDKRYAIEQGASFNWLTLVADDDYTDWVPRGQIRTNYASSGGIIKASFNFLPLVIGETTLPNSDEIITGTIIKPYLTALQTASLDWIETRMQNRNGCSSPVPGKNVWVYDIELESPQNTIIRIVEGFIEVSLEVTRL